MNFKYSMEPKKVKVTYTGYKTVGMDEVAFTDLMNCFSNSLIAQKNMFDDDIEISDSATAVLWREAVDQYKYYTGEEL